MRWLAALVVLTGCSSEPAVPAQSDASPPDAAVPLAPAHLVLSEVYSQIAMWEFIEIINRTDAAVALDDYYLADDDVYATLPAGPGISDSDFIVGFPAGSSIPPGGLVVVARDGAAFADRFALDADFAIDGGGNGAAMRRVLVGNDAQLSDTGEAIVLLTWDGTSPRVTDVDIVLTGVPQASNRLSDKALLGMGYASDALTMDDFGDVTNDAQSYKRILGDFDQIASGGNGIDGHDETSERTNRSWGTPLTFSAPTPGEAAPGLLP